MSRDALALIFLLGVPWLPSTARGAIIHVPGDQPTIQAGIDVAQSGDVVLVDPGTYFENIDFKGKAITVTSSQGAAFTTIDGRHQGSVVSFTNGEGAASTLSGFTLTHGSGSRDPDAGLSLGGGIRCGAEATSHCSPTIENNVITANEAAFGGGISCYNESSATIRNNVLQGNLANNSGAGILCQGAAAPLVTGNTISGNTARIEGGGISCRFYSSAMIVGNTISDNTAWDFGGGILLYVSHAIIEGNTIAGNRTFADTFVDEGLGGGICSFVSSPTITGNELLQNSANVGGGIAYDVVLGWGTGWAQPNIIGNHFDGNVGQALGGGIFGARASTPHRIEGNRFENNVSQIGGGVDCVQASPQIVGNEFLHNEAYYGGGLGIGGDSTAAAAVVSNVFVGNTATYGGAIEGGGQPSPAPAVVFAGNVIARNEASQFGGGAHLYGFSLVINNVVFANSALKGGGFYCGSPSPADLVFANNTIVGNSASDRAGGIGYQGTNADVANCIVWGNAPTQIDGIGPVPEVTYSDVQGGFAGQGNVDVDPLFVDQAGGDLHLLAASPCRGAGSPSAKQVPSIDLEEDPRATPNAIDIGADEFHLHLYILGDLTPGGSITLNVIGDPGATPALLIVGSGVQDPPIVTPYGDFFLQFPIVVLSLGTIPPSGVLVVAATIPPALVPPLSIPMQGDLQHRFSNLAVLQLR
jgi:parallel beta-helix repeat protein